MIRFPSQNGERTVDRFHQQHAAELVGEGVVGAEAQTNGGKGFFGRKTKGGKGIGVWTNGNDSIFIQVEMEYWGSLTAEDHKGYDTLLWGDFDGMVDENNARFIVRGYEGVVPPTEIMITKQRVIDTH